MPKRQKVTITIFDGEQYDGDWPTPGYPATLVGTIAWFQEKMAQIPPAYRKTARCEIGSTRGYEDSHYGHITISYERLETDEERAERVAKSRERAEVQKQAELAALRALRAKYPAEA